MANENLISGLVGFADSFGSGLQLGSNLKLRNDKLQALSQEKKRLSNVETERNKQSKITNLFRLANSSVATDQIKQAAFKQVAGALGFELPKTATSSPERLNNFRDGLKFIFQENANLKDKNTGEFITSEVQNEVGKFISTWTSLGLPEDKITAIAENFSSAKIQEASAKAQQQQDIQQRQQLIISLSQGENPVATIEDLQPLSTERLQSLAQKNIQQKTTSSQNKDEQKILNNKANVLNTTLVQFEKIKSDNTTPEGIQNIKKINQQATSLLPILIKGGFTTAESLKILTLPGDNKRITTRINPNTGDNERVLINLDNNTTTSLGLVSKKETREEFKAQFKKAFAGDILTPEKSAEINTQSDIAYNITVLKENPFPNETFRHNSEILNLLVEKGFNPFFAADLAKNLIAIIKKQ